MKQHTWSFIGILVIVTGFTVVSITELLESSASSPVAIASTQPEIRVVQQLPTSFVRPALPLSPLQTKWKESKKACVPAVRKYKRTIRRFATKHDLQPSLVSAVILVESCGNPQAISSSHAIGLMQVKHITKKDTKLRGNLRNPKDNIRIGTAYLARLEEHYGYKKLDALLVAYNEGPTATRHMSRAQIRSREYPRKVRIAMNLFN